MRAEKPGFPLNPTLRYTAPMLVAFALLLQAAPIEGTWTNPTRSVTVKIGPCGDAWCGTVIAASDKAKADAAKGGTPNLVGTQLLTGFTDTGKGQWKGRLFVPDINFRSHATISAASATSLKVRGCALRGVGCKSQLWSRVD
jgi:uncharacterized protein (DUF2147 family)